MKKYSLFLLLITVLISCTEKEPPLVVVNGAVFINELQASGTDWMELYNSSEQPIDVGGYAVYDDADAKYYLPAGTSIAGKGYLLLHCDGQANGLHTSFKLAAEGETIYLENSEGTLTDMVSYPALGVSQSYGRYPDGSNTFAATGSPSPGSANGNTQSPVITSVTRLPLVPRPEHDVLISATLASVETSTTVNLYYKKNDGSFVSLPMTATGNATYQASIPRLEAAGSVAYYVEASHGANLNSRYPAEAPGQPLSYLITLDELPLLLINEFMATNQSCCPDPAAQEEYDDWIEIYNAGSQSVSLEGMYLSDSRENPFKYKIPAGTAAETTIPAGGYLLLWADEQGTQGPLHVNFKLAADGEDLGLYYLDGRTIDELSFGVQSPDVSRGRMPNGGTSWGNYTSPSPGAANQ